MEAHMTTTQTITSTGANGIMESTHMRATVFETRERSLTAGAALDADLKTFTPKSRRPEQHAAPREDERALRRANCARRLQFALWVTPANTTSSHSAT